MAYIDSILNGLNKKFADKNETNKVLRALEKQIKTLFEMLMKDSKDHN